MTTGNTQGDSAALRRLRKFNPFVVGLDDRKGQRRENFQFFDGKSNLVTLPMNEFDGFPLKNEYRFFLTIIALVIAATIIPPLVILLHPSTTTAVAIEAVYAFAMAIVSVWTAFHLTAIRNDYRAANNELLIENFAARARGIRSIIHTFKSIVRWRRFLRYTMNAAYLTLILIFVVSAGAFLHAQHDDGRVTTAAILVLVGALSFVFFEFGRRAYTEGMDPTLALVMMVEDIGGQLMARGQTRVIGNGGE